MAGISLSELPSISELSDNDLLLVSKIDQDNQIEGSKKISVANLKNLINECIREKMFVYRGNQLLFKMTDAGNDYKYEKTVNNFNLEYKTYDIYYLNNDSMELDQRAIIFPFAIYNSRLDVNTWSTTTKWNPLDPSNEIPSQYVTKVDGHTGNNFEDVYKLQLPGNDTKLSYLSKFITVPYDGELRFSFDTDAEATDINNEHVLINNPLNSVGAYIYDENGNNPSQIFNIDVDAPGNTIHRSSLVKAGTKIRIFIQGIGQSITYNTIALHIRPMI